MVPCCTFFFCAEALSQPVSLPLCPSARRGISSLACSGKLVLVLFSVVKCWKLAELKITSNVASVQHNTPIFKSHTPGVFLSHLSDETSAAVSHSHFMQVIAAQGV